MIVPSIAMRSVGLDTSLKQQGGGLDLNILLIFSTAFSMGGSLNSLAISKWIIKKTMGVKSIEMPINSQEQCLISTVEI